MKTIIHDLNLGQNIEVFYLLLMLQNKYTLLPELMEIFGKDLLIKFLSVFSGTTIQVPSLDDIKKTARDVDIYVTMMKGNKAEMRKYLSDKYSLSDSMVDKVYTEVKGNVEMFYGTRITK